LLRPRPHARAIRLRKWRFLIRRFIVGNGS